MDSLLVHTKNRKELFIARYSVHFYVSVLPAEMSVILLLCTF